MLQKTTEEFLAEYQKLNVSGPMSPYVKQTYDTVWTVALTLEKSMRIIGEDLLSFSYETGRHWSKTFLRVMGKLEFMGVSVSSTLFFIEKKKATFEKKLLSD